MAHTHMTLSNPTQTRSDNHNITKPAAAIKKPYKIFTLEQAKFYQ